MSWLNMNSRSRLRAPLPLVRFRVRGRISLAGNVWQTNQGKNAAKTASIAID